MRFRCPAWTRRSIPTWSPDGTRIAFSGLTGGLTDLFTVDVASGAVNRLTNDAYADIQPAWSPDGERIAFATDRFTTKLDTLDVGAYQVALINPASRQIERVAGFADGQEHEPAVGRRRTHHLFPERPRRASRTCIG